tara:strand:+ start:706 stop:1512 length:807 start_codon:yes stop_codon:yes gene_type:complete
MAKRFVDTSIWGKKWFRELKPKTKLFYFYMITNCDHAGMYDVDLELAAFQIGMPISSSDINKILKHIKMVKEDKWHIKGFIDFQYGELKDTNNAHISVIKILKKYGILAADEGLACPSQADQVKDKALSKDNNKVKEKEKMDPSILKVSAAHKKTIGYREVQFKKNVSAFQEYEKDMRIDFTDYWTEASNNKMRWEREKVFDIGRRLARWAKNDFNKIKNPSNFKLDGTGKFYIGYCQKCGQSESYDRFELSGDSKCECKAKILPKRG